MRVGKVIGRWKMGKHFKISIQGNNFRYERDMASITQEAALDGVYAIRSSLQESTAQTLVRNYKRLSKVEQAFRNMKSCDLQIRPIRHYKTPRVISHIFLCMLSFYVQWHMKQRLAPMLFHEDDPEGKQAANPTVLATRRSASAEQKARTKKNAAGEEALCFRSLMDHLATLCKHEVTPRNGNPKEHKLTLIGSPSRTQARAFKLLGVKIK